MRNFRALSAWALGLAFSLSACQAPQAPPMTSSVLRQEGLSLRVSLAPNDGLSLLAVPAKRTLADIDRLEVFLQLKSGTTYVAVDAASGEASPQTSNPVKLSVAGPMTPGRTLTFGKLKGNTEYRILVRAYKGSELISDDARSMVEVPVLTNSIVAPVTVPVTLVTPFGAGTQVSFSLWGATRRIDHVRATLSNPTQGVVAGMNVPFAQLSKALNLAQLQSNMTYKLDLEAMATGGGVAIATTFLNLPVTDDEVVGARAIALSVKGDMQLPLDGYDDVGVDAAGNLYALTSRDGQTAAVIHRFTPNGQVSNVAIPFRTDSLAVAATGACFGLGSSPGFSYRAFRVGPNGEITYPSNDAAYGLTADADGNVYVAFNNRIVKYAPDGQETVLPTSGSSWKPMAIAKDGTIVFVDEVERHLRRMRPKAAPETGYEAPGIVYASLPAAANAVAVDAAGNAYVALRDGTVQRITPEGVMTSLGSFLGPRGVAVDDQNNVYISELSRGTITVY
ncbi:SMP-30/Gluconolaconase/LRE-like region [compost metagenome]